MFRLLPIALVAWQTLIAAGPIREVTSQAALVGDQPVPAFFNGYIYFVDSPDNYIRLYAPDGHLAFANAIQQQRQKPGPIFTYGIAVDTDGTVAVSWVYGQEGGGTAEIDFFDTNGLLTSSISTGTYIPAHLAFDGNHDIWSFGSDSGYEWGSRKGDYMTVRKYSRGGKQLGAWLPRSTFPAGLPPAPESWQSTNITVIGDRVGLLAYAGKVGSLQRWVELSLEGDLIGRWDVDGTGGDSVALTTDGHVYLQARTATSNTRLYTLDRAAAKWNPVTSPMKGQLAGADGTSLVFYPWGHGPMHLYWFQQPQD